MTKLFGRRRSQAVNAPKAYRIKYETQTKIWGLVFILPWFLGLLIFFAVPFVQTLWYSLNDVTPAPLGLEKAYVGFSNYKKTFTSLVLGTSNQTFTWVLMTAILDLLLDLPIVLIFSLFVAVLLNTKFKGRSFVRAIFFIPVIFNATAVNIALSSEISNYLQANSSGTGTAFFNLINFESFLMEMGIGRELINFLITAVNRIFSIVNVSGVPILIFLAALQSIPKYLYEAAKMEGATSYETFWKITFPMVSPMFLVVIVYTVVDNFMSSSVIAFIDQTRNNMDYGLSSAVAVVYFIMNILVLVLIFVIYRLLAKIGVFYYEKK